MCLRYTGLYFVYLCILQHLVQGQTWEGCSRHWMGVLPTEGRRKHVGLSQILASEGGTMNHQESLGQKWEDRAGVDQEQAASVCQAWWETPRWAGPSPPLGSFPGSWGRGEMCYMVNKQHGLKVCVLTSPVMGQIDLICFPMWCTEKDISSLLGYAGQKHTTWS